MMNKQPHQKLLRRMLTLEIIGEEIYNALAHKVKDKDLRSIYERLALNESETGACIEKELKMSCENADMPNKTFIANTAAFLFKLSSARILFTILKSALEKRMYNRWHHLYHASNQEFWDVLLKHEEVQRELLNLSDE